MLLITTPELAESDLGEPLHSLVVCGEYHPMEEEALTKLATYFNGQQEQRQKNEVGRGVFHIIGLGLGQPGEWVFVFFMALLDTRICGTAQVDNAWLLVSGSQVTSWVFRI